MSGGAYQRLASVFQRLQPAMDGVQIAEAVWLAWHMRGTLPLARGVEPPDGDLLSPGNPEPGHSSPADDNGFDTKAPVRRLDTAAQDAGEARRQSPVLSATDFDGQVLLEVSAPLDPARFDSLLAYRGLRRLKRRTATHRWQVDEWATAEFRAEFGRWMPVLSRAQDSWLDLLLITDAGLSMVPWRAIVDQFCLEFARLGAFRDLRRVYLDSGGEIPALTADARGTGRHDPFEHYDPTGRRAVIIVTDGVGPFWRSPKSRHVLRRWAKSSPIAIFNTLPQRLWPRTGLAASVGRMTSASWQSGRSTLVFSPPPGRPADGFLPVPVFEITPDWLGAWASILTGNRNGISAAAIDISSQWDDGPLLEDIGQPEPATLVKRFRESASATALHLAGYLAVTAPLNMCVIRFVRDAAVPAADTSHIAEVLNSGMLYCADTRRAAVDPDTVCFDFLPGTRDLLLEWLRPADAVEVVRQVLDAANRQQLLTTAPDLRPSQYRTYNIPAQPLAAVSRWVLDRLNVPGAIAASPANEPHAATESDADAFPPAHVLDLSDRGLDNLPEELAQRTDLYVLDLSHNQLTELPRSIAEHTELRILDLSHNQLTSLPPEIFRLPKLLRLNVSANLLEALPDNAAAAVRSGLGLELAGNPVAPPVELRDKDNAALAAYVDSLQDAVALYETKVIVVGEGNVGKSSLVAALHQAPFVEGRPTTHGISVSTLHFAHPATDGQLIRARVWDFGGQEVYRITHQFFFTKRAIYLLVWRPREGVEASDIEGWLRRVRLRVGTDATVLVVATHGQERPAELDYRSLDRHFPGILAGGYVVDSMTGYGIAEVRHAIAIHAAAMPQMGLRLSRRWIAARDEVVTLAQQRQHIAFGEFENICLTNGVRDQEIPVLADLLHDLGQIIYFGHDVGLHDIVVLNPEWITSAIGYVLEDFETRRAGGVLDHARLSEILGRYDEHTFRPEHYPFILRLMEKFDISYRLPDNPRHSIIAQLVPYERPEELPWDFGGPLGEGTRRLRLVFQLSDITPGLIAWITVHHHAASTGQHWRQGVFLRHPNPVYQSEALIEIVSGDQLVVEVRAPGPNLFFFTILDSIESLARSRWPGLQYEMLIPCPTALPDGTMACSGRFPLAGLETLLARGTRTTPCLHCFADHSIPELLTGFVQRPVDEALDGIGSRMTEIEASVQKIGGVAANNAHITRALLMAAAAEIPDCPRLFTIRRVSRRLPMFSSTFELVLWCEHPGEWHPLTEAAYSLRQNKEWLTAIAPYAQLMAKVLAVALPVTAVGAFDLLDDETPERLRQMNDLFGEVSEEATRPMFGGATGSPSFRALRQILFSVDPQRYFGGLHRVGAPDGTFLWVCGRHYRHYDPGLPELSVAK